MGEGLFQPTHVALILLLAFVLFGAGQLSEVGAALGKSVREFRQGIQEPSARAQANEQHCSRCGRAVQPDDRFCAGCGAPIAPQRIA